MLLPQQPLPPPAGQLAPHKRLAIVIALALGFVATVVRLSGPAANAAVTQLDEVANALAGTAPRPKRSAGLTVMDNLTVTNKYGASAATTYPWASEYLALVEPHRITTLSVDAPGRTVTWIVQHASGSAVSLSGAEVTHVFTKASTEYSVEVTIDDVSTTYPVLCKYVRRELRQLDEYDRKLFLHTLHSLYATNTSVGQALHGELYMSAHDFARIHNTLSGQVECDHLHGGLGFLPQHAAMTYRLEQSLQSVEPVLTVPYWDFTIEAARMVTEGNNEIANWYALSELWAPDWFGTMGSSNSSYVVEHGLWGYHAVQTDSANAVDDNTAATNLSVVVNPWGLVRSPWNTNAVPYLTRSKTSFGFWLDEDLVPDCAAHYDVLRVSDWNSFGYQIQEVPHGSLHILIGGTFNADFKTALTALNYSETRARALGTITQARTWRKGWLSCPTTCSSDAPAANCSCSCPDLAKWERTDKSVRYMLKEMYPNLANAAGYYTNDNGADVSTELLELYCAKSTDINPHVGDFMQSSSPVDPVFWPTHPTLDRLWHWRLIQGMSETAAASWSANDCWGHNAEDTTIWHKLFDEEDDKYYTVSELSSLFSSLNSSVPYVYADFEWDHCVDVGYAANLMNVV